MKVTHFLVGHLFPLFAFLATLQGCSRADKPVDGAAVFRQCASCHQVGANARGGFGPQLNGAPGPPPTSPIRRP
jgi:cytochrome c